MPSAKKEREEGGGGKVGNLIQTKEA